jgi:hypothetical protein
LLLHPDAAQAGGISHPLKNAALVLKQAKADCDLAHFCGRDARRRSPPSGAGDEVKLKHMAWTGGFLGLGVWAVSVRPDTDFV